MQGQVTMTEDPRAAVRGADCVITVGDRAEDGTDLIIAECAWPVASSAMAASMVTPGCF